MSKSKNIPTVGENIFTLSQNNFSDRFKVTEIGLNQVNVLSYVAVEAVKVMSVAYVDDKMNKVVINKGRTMEEDSRVPAEYIINVEDTGTERRKNSTDIFLDEAEANEIALGMNQQFKQEAKIILDMITKVYHEYDNIMDILKTSKKSR